MTAIGSTATLTLPWPDRRLSPNARVHWAALAKAKKAAKKVAYYTVEDADIGKIPSDRLLVRYSFFPPSNRRFDMDNLVASMKAYADGISDAVGIDDSAWTLCIAPLGPVEKNGMVKVELEWGE